MFLTYQLSEQAHVTNEMLHSAFCLSVLRSWFIGICEGIRVELIVGVNLLALLKTNYCEIICQECFHRSRTKVVVTENMKVPSSS